MNTKNSYPGSGGGSFRAETSATKPSGDAEPTERLISFREPLAPGLRPALPNRRPAVPAGGQRARIQRTRRTVDLPAPTHRALDIWQREAADRLGVARVTGQEVLTALIDQLLADPKLSVQVTRAIQQRR